MDRVRRVPVRRLGLLVGGILLCMVSARAQTDAVTREMTVFNDLRGLLTVATSGATAREVTLWNDLRTLLLVSPAGAEAREVTLWNDLRALLTVDHRDAFGREVTLFNDLRALLPGPMGAIARELTIGSSSVDLSDARLALRIAAGLIKPAAGDTTRLDMAGGTSAGKIDILDAVKITRRAVGLDP